ncbi:MAG: YciI family protein, partial [Bacteroidota bacterium]
GSFEKVVEVLPDHMDFVHKIEREKTMVMGGQTTNEGADDAGGYGMIVIRANSFAEARKIADQDPMHKTGVRKYTLFKWNINEGFLNIKYKLSDQTFTVE